jgi:cytochrome b involved in lipid metabolism
MESQKQEEDSQLMSPPATVVMKSMEPPGDRKMNDSTMPPPPRYSARVTNQPSAPSTSSSSSVTAESTTKPANKPRVPKAGPRFGLHDWKRLLAASKDLAQLKGQPPRRDISPQEIRQHNKNHDGWIILRGRVYNIGPYLPYHPGGIETFKNILGKDATTMFDKYHRWVNIDGLIGPLMIGTVATGPSPMSNQYSVVPPKESHLTNAPRIPIPQVLASSTALSPIQNDDDDDEEEDDLLLPSQPTA